MPKLLVTIFASLLMVGSALADDYGIGPVVGANLAKSARTYYRVLAREHVKSVDDLSDKQRAQLTDDEKVDLYVFPSIVDSVVDEYTYYRSNGPNGFMCIPEKAPREPIRKAVAGFLEKAENLSKANGRVVVIAALAELYPCVSLSGSG